MIQLGFGENRLAAVRKIIADEIGRESGPETAELGEVLVVGADDAKMPSAYLPRTRCHGTQPCRLFLLGDALWHRRKVFGIDPVTIRVLGGDVSRVCISRVKSGSGERHCSLLVLKVLVIMGSHLWQPCREQGWPSAVSKLYRLPSSCWFLNRQRLSKLFDCSRSDHPSRKGFGPQPRTRSRGLEKCSSSMGSYRDGAQVSLEVGR